MSDSLYVHCVCMQDLTGARRVQGMHHNWSCRWLEVIQQGCLRPNPGPPKEALQVPSTVGGLEVLVLTDEY